MSRTTGQRSVAWYTFDSRCEVVLDAQNSTTSSSWAHKFHFNHPSQRSGILLFKEVNPMENCIYNKIRFLQERETLELKHGHSRTMLDFIDLRSPLEKINFSTRLMRWIRMAKKKGKKAVKPKAGMKKGKVCEFC